MNVPPGGIASWVRLITPSMALGTSIPCQWTVVGSGSSLWTTTRTLSPSFTSMVGPGMVPSFGLALPGIPGMSFAPPMPGIPGMSISFVFSFAPPMPGIPGIPGRECDPFGSGSAP